MGDGGKVKDQKELFSVSMSTTRVYEDGRRYDTIVAESLRKTSSEKYTPQVTFHGINREGAYPMLNYYNFSKWYGPYSFPTCSLLEVVLPDDQIKSILAQKENVPVDSIKDYSSSWKVVSNNVWNTYRLQELYGYRINSSYINIDGFWYKLGEVKTASNVITTNVILVAQLKTEELKEVVTNIKPKNLYDIKVVEEFNVTRVLDATLDAVIQETRVSERVTEEEVPKGSVQESVSTIVISTSTVPQETEGITSIVTPAALLNYAYQVYYQVNGIDKLWVYYPLVGTSSDIGQTNIPGLNVPVTDSGSTLEAYPLTILRHNHFSLDEWNINSKALDAGDDTYHVNRPSSITEQTYEDTEWVLNGLNLHLEDLLEAISENPDIDKVSDVILCMAVEATDTHPITSKILFESFREFNIINRPDVKAFTMSRDPFNSAISWEGVESTTSNKVIGELGLYKHNLVDIPYTTYYGNWFEITTAGYYGSRTLSEYTGSWRYETNTDSSPLAKPHRVVLSSSLVGTTTVDYDYTVPGDRITRTVPAGTALTMEHQITDTVVEEVVIYNLLAATTIGRSVQETTQNEATSDAFILPLVTNVIDKMTPLEKVEVLERSLRFVFYAAQMHIQNIYWYQTGIFQTILQILAIIIIVVVSYFTAGSTTAPLTAFFQSLFQTVLIGVAISVAIKFIVSVIDVPYLKEILGIVVTVVSMYYGYIDTSFLNVMLTAVDLVNAAIAITLGEINTDTMKINENRVELSNKYEETSEYYTQLYEEFNQGLSTEKIVELASSEVVQLIPVNEYYNLTTGNMLANYSLLFDTPYSNVSDFYDNSLDLTKRFN